MAADIVATLKGLPWDKIGPVLADYAAKIYHRRTDGAEKRSPESYTSVGKDAASREDDLKRVLSNIETLHADLANATDVISGLVQSNQILVDALKAQRRWLWILSGACVGSAALSILSVMI